MSQEVKRFFIGTVRGIARILALLVSGPFLYFLIFRSGEVVPSLSWTVPNEMPLFVAWIAVIVGVLMSWRWQMIGGFVTAASAIAIGALAYAGCGAEEFSTCMVVAVPYFLSGLLLLGCCWGSERLESSQPASDIAG